MNNLIIPPVELVTLDIGTTLTNKRVPISGYGVMFVAGEQNQSLDIKFNQTSNRPVNLHLGGEIRFKSEFEEFYVDTTSTGDINSVIAIIKDPNLITYKRSGNQITGHGKLKVYTITNPGAGNNISYTQPAGVRWRIITLSSLFTCDGATGNRQPRFTVEVGGREIIRTQSPGTLSAGQAAVLTLVSGGAIEDTPQPVSQLLACPNRLLLNNQSVIKTITGSIKSGDTYTNISLYVEEWQEDL